MLFRSYRIDSVLELLNQQMSIILAGISNGDMQAQFVSQKNSSSGRKVLDKIDIMVKDKHKELPVDLISGGQSTQVGLATLLAVWLAAKKTTDKSVNCLFLDEVFGTLSQGLVDGVFEQIVACSKEVGASSVFVISHRDLDQQMFDKVVEITNTNGISLVGVANV